MAVKLYYFDGRGRAEIIRIVLAYAGVQGGFVYLRLKLIKVKLSVALINLSGIRERSAQPLYGREYEEVDFTSKEQWLDFKKEGKSAFNQVPLLEIDGLNLVQSGAIVRYLGRKYNLFGSNDQESALIDSYYEGTRDFYNPAFVSLVFMDENQVLKNTRDVLMPKYLPCFEKILQSTGKFLTSDVISIADLGLLESLLAIEEFIGLESLNEFPRLKEYYQKLKSNDKIEAFLKSPQRKKRNDEAYVANVKSVLY